MATIALVTSAPPLTEGGHLVIARAIDRTLKEMGHTSSLVTTPSNRFGRQASAYLATWLTDVGVTGSGTKVDQVISLRFPSYAVRHPVHVTWLNHTMREYYDLWDDFSVRLSTRGRIKERVRRAAIHRADTFFLSRVTRRFVQSHEVLARLTRWNRLDATVLHPPPPPRPYRSEGYGDYLFFASRLTPLKRADLALRALAEPTARGVRLVVGGEGEEQARLVSLARDLGIEARVTFTGRLTEEALLDHLARCRAVVFPPKKEDYGFVTVEAFAAGKAVITCSDSGGPLDLVTDRVTGLVVEPTPAAVASAMVELTDSPASAEAWGRAGQAIAAAMSWHDTVGRLIV